MRFFASASAILAIATSALAQTADFDPVYTPKKGEVVPAGSTYEVTWSAPAKYKDGKISISLIGGADPNSLVPLSDIASGIPNSDEKYSWAVDSSLGAEATYGLVVKLESNPDIFQYSNPFKVKAGNGDGGDGGDDGKPIYTVTTATGIKTVTLTSCPPSTTSTISTTSAISTTSTPIQTTTSTPNTTSVWTTTHAWNTSSTFVVPSISTTLPPPVSTGLGQPETSAPAPAPEPTPTDAPGAGSHLVAGPVALIGGLAMAFLAL